MKSIADTVDAMAQDIYVRLLPPLLERINDKSLDLSDEVFANELRERFEMTARFSVLAAVKFIDARDGLRAQLQSDYEASS